MMITMSIFSDVSVNAQDISTDAFDAVDAILSDDSADSSADESSESADSSSNESSESTDGSSDESSESADSSADESSESTDESTDSNESADSSNNEISENTDESTDNASDEASVDNAEDNASDSTEDKGSASDSTENKDNASDNANADNAEDKTEDNNSSSSSSSSSEEPEEAPTEAVEESTEVTTEKVEESTETTTEAAEESTEETVEQTTEENVEETAEQTTEKTANDLLGGAIDEKDEAEAVGAIDKTVAVYVGFKPDDTSGFVASANTVEVTLPEAVGDTIKTYDGKKLKVVSSEASSKYTAATSKGTDAIDGNTDAATGYKVTITPTASPNGPTDGTEEVFTVQVYDDTDGVINSEIYKIRVKAIASSIDNAGASGKTNITNTVDDKENTISNSADDYIKMSTGATKEISIPVDEGIIENTHNSVGGKIKWEVFKNADTSTLGKLTDADSGATAKLEIEDNADSPATTSTNGSLTTNVFEDGVGGGKICRVKLKAKAIGKAYIRASVGDVIVYQGRVDIGVKEDGVTAEENVAHIGGVVKLEFTDPTTSIAANTKVKWTISGGNATNFPASGTSKIIFGKDNATVTADGAAAGTTGADGKVILGGPDASNTDYVITSNKSALYMNLKDAEADTINVVAEINDVEVYSAKVTVTAAPTFEEDKNDLSETDMTKHEVSLKNRTDIKSGAIKKVEIPNFANNYTEAVDWKVYKDITTDEDSKATVTGTALNDGAELMLSIDDTNFTSATAALAAADANKGKGYVYVKAVNTKASSYYIQGTVNGVPIYLGKICVTPANHTITEGNEKFILSTDAGSQPSIKEIVCNGDGIYDFNDTGKLFEWKLKYYTIDNDNTLKDETDYTGSTDKNPTKYFQFVDGTATDCAIAATMTEDENNKPVQKVKIKTAAKATPDDVIIMLVGSVNGVEVSRTRLTSQAITAVTNDVKEINSEVKNNIGVKLLSENIGNGVGFKNIVWQVYSDANFSQPITDAQKSPVILTKELKKKYTPASGETDPYKVNENINFTDQTTTCTDSTGACITDSGQAYVYAHSTGVIGEAYVQAKVDGFVIYQGTIKAGADVLSADEIVIYDGEEVELTKTLGNGQGGKLVTWSLVGSDYNTAETPGATTHVKLAGKEVATSNTHALSDGKISLKVKADGIKFEKADGTKLDSVTNYIVAKIGTLPVYRAEIKILPKPFNADGTTSIKASTTIGGVKTEVGADTNGNKIPEIKLPTNTGAQDYAISLSGLGDVTNTEIQWSIHKRDNTGNGYEKATNADIIDFKTAAGEDNSKTTILNGKGTLNITVKANAIGIVKITGVSKDSPDVKIYEFEALVAPNESTVTSEKRNIISNASASSLTEHKLTGTVSDSGLQGVLGTNEITWAITDANGGSVSTTTAIIDSSKSSKTMDASSYTLSVTLKEKFGSGHYKVCAYVGSPKDKIKVHEFDVYPIDISDITDITASGSLGSPKEKSIMYDATAAVPIETPNLKGCDFDNVTWQLYSDAKFENKIADGSDVLAKISTDSAFPASSPTPNTVINNAPIDKTTNKSKIYIKPQSKKAGDVYIKAEVDGVAVYYGKVSIGRNLSPIDEFVMYEGQEKELKFDFGKAADVSIVADGDEVVWTQVDSADSPKTDFALGGKNVSSVKGKVVKESVTPAGGSAEDHLLIKLDVTAPEFDSTNGAAKNYIIATIGGSPVYKAYVENAEYPNRVNSTLTGDVLNMKLSSANEDSVTISGLNNATGVNVDWNVYLKGTTTSDASIVVLANKSSDLASSTVATASTPIEAGSTTIYLKKLAKLGSVTVVGTIDGKELYSFDVNVTPEDGSVATADFDVYENVDNKYKLEVETKSTAANQPLVGLENKEIEWEVLDGSDRASGDIVVDDLGTNKTLKANDVTKLNPIIKVANTLTAGNKYKLVAKVKGSDISVAEITLNVCKAPNVSTTVKSNLDIAAATPLKIETADLGGANLPDVTWQLYSDAAFENAIAGDSIVKIGNTTTITDGTVTCTGAKDSDNNKNYIYISPHSTQKGLGTIYIKASIGNIDVYKGEITVTKDLSNIETKTVYTNSEIELDTGSLNGMGVSSGKVTWKQTNVTGTNKSDFGMGGSTGVSEFKVDFAAAGAKLKIKAPSEPKAGYTFTAYVSGIPVYKVKVNAVSPTDFSEVCADVKDIGGDGIPDVSINASDTTAKEIKLTNLKDTSNKEITWSIETLENGSVVNKAKDIVTLLDKDDTDITSTKKADIEEDATTKVLGSVLKIKPKKGTNVALGKVRITGKVDDAIVYQFDVTVGLKPDVVDANGNVTTKSDEIMEKADVPVYSSFKDYEIIQDITADFMTGATQKLFDKEKITWVYDSTKVKIDEAGTTKTLNIPATAGSDADEKKIIFKIKNLDITNANDYGKKIPVKAYLGSEADGILIYRFNIIPTQSPDGVDSFMKEEVIFDDLKTDADKIKEYEIKNLPALAKGQPITWKFVKSEEEENVAVTGTNIKFYDGTNEQATTVTSNGTNTDEVSTTLKVKYSGVGIAYAIGTVTPTGSSTPITVAKRKLVSRKAPIKENKTVAVGDVITQLSIDKNSLGEDLDIKAASNGITWYSGTSSSGTDTIGNTVIAIGPSKVSTFTNPGDGSGNLDDFNGDGTIDDFITINAVAKGDNGFIKAVDKYGCEVYRCDIKVVDKPTVSDNSITTNVGKEETLTVSKFGNLEGKVKWEILDADEDPIATGIDFIGSDGNKITLTAGANSTETDVENSSSSIKIKATKDIVASNSNSDNNVRVIKASINGIEVAKFTVKAEIETIDYSEIKVARGGSAFKITYPTTGYGFDKDNDRIEWQVGTYSAAEGESLFNRTQNDVELSNSETTWSNIFASTADGTESVAVANSSVDGKEASAYLKLDRNADDSVKYFIKGILNGKEVYKAYITPTENSTVTAANVNKITLNKGITETFKGYQATVGGTVTAFAANDIVRIGKLEPKFSDAEGKVLDVANCVESEPDNTVLQFADSIFKKDYTIANNSDTLNIKGREAGWAYISVIKNGTVTAKYYINVVDSNVSDVKFDNKDLLSNKSNGLEEITGNSAKITAAGITGTVDRAYKLDLYQNDGNIQDSNLNSKRLSSFDINPVVIDNNNKTITAISGIVAKGTDVNGIQDATTTLDCVDVKPNGKGGYTVSLKDTAKDYKSGSYVIYFKTTALKALDSDGKTTATGDPIKTIAVAVTPNLITGKSAVNTDTTAPDTDSDKYFTTVTNTALQYPSTTTSITAGEMLRIKFDGTNIGVVKVKEDQTKVTADNKELGDADDDVNYDAANLPEGKWIICANKFENNSASNAKTSSAAKMLSSKGTFSATTIENEDTVIIGATKAKGNDSNTIYLRYVNLLDSNIVYAQVPITIAPAQTSGFTFTAKGIKTIAGTANIHNMLPITMGSKASTSITNVKGSNRKEVIYSFDTTATDDGLSIVTDPEKYIQVNSKGVITPIQPTPIDADDNNKPSYVKLVATSVDNSGVSQSMLIKVEPKVNSLVLNQGTISVAKGSYQSTAIRVNPTYVGSNVPIKVEIPDGAPFELYETYDFSSGEFADKVTDRLTIENGLQNLYIKMSDEASAEDFAKGKDNKIVFTHFVPDEEDSEKNTSKVKPVTLNVKLASSVNNVGTVVQKLSKTFAAPIGVPCDLKVNVNPTTATNLIKWEVKKDSSGSEVATAAGDYVITNGWFIPLTTNIFYLHGTAVGDSADGEAIKVDYTVNVYKPVKSLKIEGAAADNGGSNTYSLYGGYLKGSQNHGNTEIKGGDTITLSISEDNAIPGEKITWTSSNPIGLAVEDVAAASGATAQKIKLHANAAGTYTISGVTEHSKQKFSFKVVVGDNLVVREDTTAVTNIEKDLVSFKGSADVTFKIDDGTNQALVDNDEPRELSKGKAYHITAEASGVAFSKIAFTSSNTKYLSVNANGTITPKAETPEGEYVTIKVSMTGTTENSKDEKVNVNITREFNFKVGLPVVSITNAPNYLKDDFVVPGKPYTFSAKINGITASKVDTRWKIAQESATVVDDPSTLTPAGTLDASFLNTKFANTIEGTAGTNYTIDDKANTVKVTFKADAGQQSKTYYIYPEVYESTAASSDLLYSTALNGTTVRGKKLTDFAKKVTVVGNPVKTVNLSQKSITTTPDADGKTFNVFVKAFSADGEQVSLDDIKWTSSNQSIARIDKTPVSTAASGTADGELYDSITITTKDVEGSATIKGVLNNSGKSISIKVTVKGTQANEPKTLKINSNKNVTLKYDPDKPAVKQLATTFFDENGKITSYALDNTTKETWTVTPVGDDGRDGTAYTVEVDNSNGSVTGNPTTGLKFDTCGNIIATSTGTYKVKKSIGDIDMGTTTNKDNEEVDNTITVTVK